ncbi:MAG: thermonuclease family protein [Candidatus Krumholzibacteriaceae bacterium]
MLHDGKAEKVRVNGIDSPELGQPFGMNAKQYASTLIFGRVVTVRTFGTDRYGRTLGDAVLADGRSLSREMVRAGFAWWYRQYSNDRGLEALETEARQSRRGLWADASPTAPWAWRKTSRGTYSAHTGTRVSARTYTGERTSAGKQIYRGPKGGRYYFNESGKKVYLTKER